MVLYGMYVGYYGTLWYVCRFLRLRTDRKVPCRLSCKNFPVKDDDAEEEKKFNEELNRWKRTETGWFDQYISLPIL